MAERRKNIYKNHNYFKNKSNDSIYWAGFIMGDGCIISDKRSNSKSLVIELKRDDHDHLDLFAKNIGGIRSDHVKFDKKYNKDRQTSRITICSRQIVQDLEDIYGITPRKTLRESPPLDLTREEALIFIAGLFDADGSYYVNKTARPAMSLVGSKKIVEWVNAILFSNKLTIKSRGRIYYIVTTGDKAILARDELHNLQGVPFLKRKYNSWEEKGAKMHISGRKENHNVS